MKRLTVLENVSLSAAPWMQGIIIVVMLLSVLWTSLGWNTSTKETDNQDPFTISIIGLSSLVVVIALFYLTVGIIHGTGKRLTPLHSFYYYGSFLIILASAGMSIVNTTTDREKRGDPIGITTIVLNLLTVFISLFIASAFIRSSIR